jgi:hypothetical protein
VALIPSRAIPSGLGVHGQRELVGVVIPGTLVLIEIWLLVLSPQHAHRRGGYLKLASSQIADVNDWILAAALVVAVLAAYTLGSLGRVAAWFFFHRLRKTRFPTGAELLKRFEREHGREPVTRALTRHDALRHALHGDEHDAFFQYAKLWLRQNRPRLAVENHETEINFLIAIEVPLLLAVFVFWRQVGWIAFVVALPASLLLAWVLGRMAISRSQAESLDVMRHFLFAQWYAAGDA